MLTEGKDLFPLTNILPPGPRGSNRQPFSIKPAGMEHWTVQSLPRLDPLNVGHTVHFVFGRAIFIHPVYPHSCPENSEAVQTICSSNCNQL